MCWFWTGSVWASVPGEGHWRLFDYDCYSAARFEAMDGGYRMLNRETGIYRATHTGEVLDRCRAVQDETGWTDPERILERVLKQD